MTEGFEPLNLETHQSSEFKQLEVETSDPGESLEQAAMDASSPAHSDPPGESSSPSDGAPAGTQGASDQDCETPPRLYVDRNGDRIERIHVLCSCGKSITLKCNYPDSDASPSSVTAQDNPAPPPPEDPSSALPHQ